MKENINYKLKNTQDAFKSLEIAFKYYSSELKKLSLANDLELHKITRDSVIQRFEYTVESCWKLIFDFLKSQHLYDDDMIISPKAVLRVALKVRLLSEEDVKKAIDMLNDRNLTSHVYKEEVAVSLLGRIPNHIKLIKKIIKAIEQEL